MSDETTAPEQGQVEAPEVNQAPAQERGLSLLASEMFGSNFTGEVKEETPETPREAEEAPETAEEVEEEAVEQPEETEPEEVPISSFQELVDSNQWDWDWFKGLKVAVSTDDKTVDATFSDLVKSYRGVETATKKVEAAKAEAQTILEEANKRVQSIHEQYAVADRLVKQIEESLSEEIGSTNWSELRETDPAEYSAKKADFDERRKKLDQLKQNAANDFRAAMQKEQRRVEEERVSRVPQEAVLLLKKIPEWENQEVAAAGKTKAVQYLLNEGFTPEEIKEAAYDHRLLVLAHKARERDELKANTSVVNKRVAKVPKVIKPGAPKPKQEIEQEKVQKLRTRLKQTGSEMDALALLKSRRK